MLESKILPIFFTPQPDAYRNVVFYIKQLNQKPKDIPQEPLYQSKIQRSGFTAIEVSFIIN